MKKTFKIYLHEDYNRSEMLEFLLETTDLDDEDAKLIADFRPFYEVTLECSFDDVHKILTYQTHLTQRLTSA